MSNNFDISAVTQKLQQLQKQVAQFTQSQSPQPDIPAMTTYPKVIRSDTVEDILGNPQWRQELEAEFVNSDLGAKAKNYADILFMEFCEKQTGKSSVMLDGLRKQSEKSKDKEAPKDAPSNRSTKKTGAADADQNTDG